MIYINRFFFNIHDQLRKFYLNTKIYDIKISKVNNCNITYKPSPYLLSSIIDYQKKKSKIEDFSLDEIWCKNNLSDKEFKNLNNFFWFFNLDLKSSKKKVQSLVSEWIEKNKKYDKRSWDFDITSKRIISWLSCHNLTYENSDKRYQDNFNYIIQKQTNHLIYEINKSKELINKLIGCSAIILVGLCYQNEKKYLSYGIDILKKISNSELDSFFFPKTRNFKDLLFYLKYFILIREWFKEAQINIPDHIEEIIYNLGQSYTFFGKNINSNFLFNGNNKISVNNFENYLKRFGYNFKNEIIDFGGYIILKNKKISLAMDTGASPNFKFSKDYQAGVLSFEIISNGKKLISNCGYYHKKNSNLNKISKSTATQSTLVINDNSSCKFSKYGNFWLVKKGVKILKKENIFKKDYWKISASHDGYLKNYNSIHERNIEFHAEKMTFIGVDKIIKKKMINAYKFDIRFHVEPGVRLMKTQDNKTILIELEDEGWRFTCNNYKISINNGLYFGKKNLYTDNQNILVSGISNQKFENIEWELKKI